MGCNMDLTDAVLATIEDRPADDVRVGLKYTAVRVGAQIGVAHTSPTHLPSPGGAGSYRGKRLAARARSWHLVEAAIGVAALNAQLQPDPSYLKDGDAFEIVLDRVKRGDFKTVGVVGAFPIAPKLRHYAETVFVFEQRPEPDCLPAAAAEELLPQCDLALITGTAFINKTMARLLEIATGYTVVLGPSTPLSPILFDHGADVLAGTLIEDERALTVIGEGGGTRAFMPYSQKIMMENR